MGEGDTCHGLGEGRQRWMGRRWYGRDDDEPHDDEPHDDEHDDEGWQGWQRQRQRQRRVEPIQATPEGLDRQYSRIGWLEGAEGALRSSRHDKVGGIILQSNQRRKGYGWSRIRQCRRCNKGNLHARRLCTWRSDDPG